MKPSPRPRILTLAPLRTFQAGELPTRQQRFMNGRLRLEAKLADTIGLHPELRRLGAYGVLPARTPLLRTYGK